MTKKITLEEAEKRLFEKHGNKIIMTNYNKMNSHANFECAVCGYKWETDPGAVCGKASTGCPECAKKRVHDSRRLSIEEISRCIKEENCEWVDGEYKNNTSKLLIKFPCGHVKPISMNDFRAKKRCPECGKIQGHKNRRIPEIEIINLVEYYGLKFIKFNDAYESHLSRIIYTCQLGHESNKRIIDFKKRPFCSTCRQMELKNELKLSFEEIKELVESKGCQLINCDGYENSDSDITVMLGCGHSETLSLATFKGKRYGRCYECYVQQSKGSGSQNWQGGLTNLKAAMHSRVYSWKKESAALYDFKCAITGKPMEHVHHLVSMNTLMEITVKELGFELGRTMSEYTDEQLLAFENKLMEVHYRYPYGIPLTKDVHILFHKFFGRGDNTPEQFEEFKTMLADGRLKLED